MHLLRQTRKQNASTPTNEEGAVSSQMNQEANATTPTNYEGAVINLMNQEANVSTPTNQEAKCIYSDKPGSKMHLLRQTRKELYLVR